MKNGSIILTMVLLVVLAIPLFAVPVLVNPVDEYLSNSSINSEEVPFTDQELMDSNVPILAVGIKPEDIKSMAGLKQYTPIENTEIRKHTNYVGGVRRIKSGRH